MREQAPKAAAILDEGFDDVTGVFGLPAEYRRRLRTSNSIERMNEELRRRERVIRIFPNEESLIRLMGSVLMDIHEMDYSQDGGQELSGSGTNCSSLRVGVRLRLAR